MDYGKLLNRSWNILWQHKFLILLGVLVALSSGVGSSSSSGTNIRFDGNTPSQPPVFEDPGMWVEPSIPFWVPILLVGVGLLVVVVLWVVSTLARGGLIAGAAAGDAGQHTSFSQAWSAGWNRGWTLLGIAIIPALPGLLLLLAGAFGFLAYATDISTRVGIPAVNTVAAIAGVLACIAVPIILILELLRVFANRACMLEDLGVLDAYRRGFEVLGNNLGSAVVLFLIQVVVMAVMFFLLIVPGILLALCCIFWPLLLLFQGAVTAFFSTMWTLAWRRWTNVAVTEELTGA